MRQILEIQPYRPMVRVALVPGTARVFARRFTRCNFPFQFAVGAA